ncbi:MAG TPA: DUF885 domain-containing protein [Chthoniobacteraceae bacterium]|jgi:hypothetical protein|nr:DUF885 domain-containing protein [Chthoniobacteraceae bacterium]
MKLSKVKGKSPAVRDFERITRDFLDASHELFPQEASELGLSRYEHRLGKNGEATYLRHIALMEKALAATERLPEADFAGDAWLDRRGFLSMLRTGLLFQRDLERWRTNPQAHCDAAVGSIFDLVIRYADRLPRVLPKIESRLARIPDFLAEGASVVRAPVPLWTRLARKSCEGIGPFLKEIEGKLAQYSARPERTAALFDAARKAFARYSEEIGRKRPGPEGSFAVGRGNMEMLVRERMGLNRSLAEIEATGWSLIRKMEDELRKEARKFGRRSAAEILRAAAQSWEPRGPSLISEYERVTLSIRDAFARKQLLTLPPGERLRVQPVPDFIKHLFPTAAYRQPGPYSRDQTGIFWVNDLGAGIRDPAKRLAETRQHHGLELTCAHEAYPGHHVQFVIQNRHPSKLRRLFAHAIFYEGWTLWCEKMCVDHRIIRKPEARLQQLQDALWRACRIVIDCGLQGGALTYAGAVKLLMERVGFTKARAEGDVNWYTSSPTVPMSYLLGRLELERLHARLTGNDGWTERQFNDYILSFGAIPWSWIWEARLRPD